MQIFRVISKCCGLAYCCQQ